MHLRIILLVCSAFVLAQASYALDSTIEQEWTSSLVSIACCPDDPFSCASDFNGDGISNNTDLLIILGAMGSVCNADGCLCEDMNEDGIVNVNDLRVFLGYFGTPC